ncbi:hypothetical protein ACFL0V_05045 [Nanoarchaeota archaeon]
MKRIMIIGLIILCLLIIGCGAKKDGDIDSYDFRKGTQGLTMKFVDGMPPSTLFVGSQFSLGLNIKNDGAYNIMDMGDIRISVPDAEAFDFPEGKEQFFTLEGKSLYVKEGQEQVIGFPMNSKCIPYGTYRKNYTAKIQAIACYPYETVAQADICIDTMFYTRQKGQKGACEMKQVSLSGGQGGPVGVTSVPKPNILDSGEKISVQISIPLKNLAGKGVSVFNPSVTCEDFRTKPEATKRMNEIEFVATLAGKPMKCRPAKILKLKQARDTGILCEIEVDKNAGAYTTPLMVHMKYHVLQKAIKEVKVSPPPEGGKAVDCQKMTSTTTQEGDRCESEQSGYSCTDVSSQCPSGDSGCITGLGCVQGLCSGSATRVCCP